VRESRGPAWGRMAKRMWWRPRGRWLVGCVGGGIWRRKEFISIEGI